MSKIISGAPQIITDGLVLYLDVANKKSYPGTGTILKDLSGFRSNVELNTFFTIDGLFINVLDNFKTETYINKITDENLTISFLVEKNINSIKTTINGVINEDIVNSPGYNQVTITLKRDGINIVEKLYINSNLITSETISTIRNISSRNRFLLKKNNSDDSRLSYILMYNKELTQEEIEKNYQSLVRNIT